MVLDGYLCSESQQHTSTMYWLILTFSGSRVSNLLALLAARTPEWLAGSAGDIARIAELSVDKSRDIALTGKD